MGEDALLHELVAQFLAHDGYIETARAFAEEVAAETAALNGHGDPLKKYEVEEDLEAINRQSESFFFYSSQSVQYTNCVQKSGQPFWMAISTKP